MYKISNIVIVKNVLKSFSGYLPDDNSENDFKTFLTITILEILYIVCQLGKILDRYVLLIYSPYW
jgi:hypothetical protein